MAQYQGNLSPRHLPPGTYKQVKGSNDSKEPGARTAQTEGMSTQKCCAPAAALLGTKHWFSKRPISRKIKTPGEADRQAVSRHREDDPGIDQQLATINGGYGGTRGLW